MEEREAIDQLRNGQVRDLNSDMNKIKVSIAKMSEKLDNIIEKIEDVKSCHDETQRCLSALNVDLASRPSAHDIRSAIKKVERHETYFMIIGAALVLITTKLIGWFDRVLGIS